jgi:membrane-bound lytic murein transglycosylase D
MLDPILEGEGIPFELASVALVESGGRTDVPSRKGALGLWQLTPDTARRYGLLVTAWQDQRLDPERSTHAAARYLTDLYKQFGSWPLALAAYNAGESAVQRAINRAGTADFLKLSGLRLLPQETRDYVPAVLAAMQLLGSNEVPEAPGTASARSDNTLVFAVPAAQP